MRTPAPSALVIGEYLLDSRLPLSSRSVPSIKRARWPVSDSHISSQSGHHVDRGERTIGTLKDWRGIVRRMNSGKTGPAGLAYESRLWREKARLRQVRAGKG
jgi:hypothetical protein